MDRRVPLQRAGAPNGHAYRDGIFSWETAGSAFVNVDEGASMKPAC